jgi:hypothetical protein
MIVYPFQRIGGLKRQLAGEHFMECDACGDKLDDDIKNLAHLHW